MKRILKFIFRIFLLLVVLVAVLSIKRDLPTSFTYGVSFSRFHADELKLDWKEVFLAMINDLGVKHFRFSAHWPLTEPVKDQFNFRELDFQMEEVRKKGLHVVFAVGRRLPGWPECHVPPWAASLSSEEQNERLLKYIDVVVRRYRSYDNILYWQVENEPYLTFFSQQACGGNLDEDFLKKEIELVRSLDLGRPILLTDSGELSTWYGAYKNGDVFGTSMYLYIWNHYLGKFKYPIGSWFFRAKHNAMKLAVGSKPAIVVELSAEPWLLQPIIDTPVDIQLSRMDTEKLNKTLTLARRTGFDTFYLWGAEWWYWLKENGHPEFWSEAKKLYQPGNTE